MNRRHHLEKVGHFSSNRKKADNGTLLCAFNASLPTFLFTKNGKKRGKNCPPLASTRGEDHHPSIQRRSPFLLLLHYCIGFCTSPESNPLHLLSERLILWGFFLSLSKSQSVVPILYTQAHAIERELSIWGSCTKGMKRVTSLYFPLPQISSLYQGTTKRSLPIFCYFSDVLWYFFTL